MARHEVPALGWWRVPGAIALVGLLIFAVGWLDHGPAIMLVLVGSAVIGVGLFVAAVIRALVDERDVGALRIRSRTLDIVAYVVAGALMVGGSGAVYWRTYVYKVSILQNDNGHSQSTLTPP